MGQSTDLTSPDLAGHRLKEPRLHRSGDRLVSRPGQSRCHRSVSRPDGGGFTGWSAAPASRGSRGPSTGLTSPDFTGPLALRPDGAGLVTQEGLVADLRSGRMEPRVLGEDLISTAAFGPDGTRPAVGDTLGRVTLWDGAARARLGVLDGTSSDPTTDATGAVTALAHPYDARTLAVAGSAGSLQLWEPASRRLLGTTLPTPGDEIRALAFGPDATLYASGTHVPVQRYDLNPGHLITEVCRRAGSGLSETAWKTYLPDLPYRRTC